MGFTPNAVVAVQKLEPVAARQLAATTSALGAQLSHGQNVLVGKAEKAVKEIAEFLGHQGPKFLHR